MWRRAARIPRKLYCVRSCERTEPLPEREPLPELAADAPIGPLIDEPPTLRVVRVRIRRVDDGPCVRLNGALSAQAGALTSRTAIRIADERFIAP